MGKAVEVREAGTVRSRRGYEEVAECEEVVGRGSRRGYWESRDVGRSRLRKAWAGMKAVGALGGLEGGELRREVQRRYKGRATKETLWRGDGVKVRVRGWQPSAAVGVGHSKKIVRGPELRTAVRALLLCSGDRIRTCDLWVMSPASYRAAPPRVVVFITITEVVDGVSLGGSYGG